MTSSTLTIWSLTDGKPGHQNQTQGLINALSSMMKVENYWIDCQADFNQRLNAAKALPQPDYVIATGSKTHLTAVILRWTYDVTTIVIMKPSLPMWLYDLSIIPQHDGVRECDGIICSQGAINDVTPANNSDPQQGLILVGGPSKHVQWNEAQVLDQIQQILALSPGTRWKLTTSRRTPESFIPAITDLHLPDLTIHPVDNTDRDWLLNAYQDSGAIWITQDSVSMIYESLTAGAKVGLITLTNNSRSRVNKGINALCDSKQVTTVDNFKRTGKMAEQTKPLNEAQRIAEIILSDYKPNKRKQ